MKLAKVAGAPPTIGIAGTLRVLDLNRFGGVFAGVTLFTILPLATLGVQKEMPIGVQ